MLRVNLVADEAFRNDIMKLVKSALRELAPQAVHEKLSDPDWVNDRFVDLAHRLDFAGKFQEVIRSRDVWKVRHFQEAINDAVKDLVGKTVQEYTAGIEASIRGKANAILADLNKKIIEEEKHIRRIVRDELRTILAEKSL